MRQLIAVIIGISVFASIASAADISHTPLAPSPLRSSDKVPLGRPSLNLADGQGTPYTASMGQILDFVKANYVITPTAPGGTVTGSVSGLMKGDGNGNVAAAVPNVDYVTPSGNAASATKLVTPRTINGVAFDGSSNITVTATDSTKAPIDNPTFTTAVTSPAYQSSAGDGGHMIECANTGAMTVTGLTTDNEGRFCYDRTLHKFRYWNGSSLADMTPTVSSQAGTKCTVIKGATASDDYPLERFPYAVTITGFSVYAIGGTNVVGSFDECTGSNGVCSSVTTVAADVTGTAGAVVANGTLSNAGIAANNWIQWHTTSVSGTNTSVSVCFTYTID